MSRPVLLIGAGIQTLHQGQLTLMLTSAYAKTGQFQGVMWRLGSFSWTAGQLGSGWGGRHLIGRW